MTARGKGILVAAVLEATLGDPPVFHPVAGFGRAAAVIERRVWAPSRSRGVAHVVTLVAAAALAGDLARGRALTEGVALWVTLGERSLVKAGVRLAELVEAEDLEGARSFAPTLMGRDPSSLDTGELCRGAVESLAENTADAFTGALLWHVLAGPAGSWAYRAANTLDAMIGHRNARYERFGWAAARLDDLMTWPAARLAALLAVGLSGRRSHAWESLRRYGRAHPSPNAGLLEAAFAGALGVRLGGTLRYGGQLEDRPGIGIGQRPSPEDVRRAARLSLRVAVASTLAAALAAWRRG